VPAALRGLAAQLAQDPLLPPGGHVLAEVAMPSPMPSVAGILTPLGCLLGRIEDLLTQLRGLTLDFPSLSKVDCLGQETAESKEILLSCTLTRISLHCLR